MERFKELKSRYLDNISEYINSIFNTSTDDEHKQLSNTDTNTKKTYLFVFFINHFRFFMPLEPHHILSVKPPALLLEDFCSQVLGFRSFQVVKDEE